MEFESFPRFEDKKEKESSPEQKSEEIEFYVTDHNLRYPETISIEDESKLYSEMKEHGISSIRFDWDWKEVFPKQGECNEKILNHYAEAMKAMENSGLQPPTLVLSNPPQWAENLYHQDKETFFGEWEKYMNTVTESLSKNGMKIDRVQLFNEINHSFLFKYVDTEDLPRIADSTRTALQKIQPDVKISTSIIVGNINDTIAKVKKAPITLDFLEKNEKMLRKNFDSISIDYYPGVWHLPFKEAEYSHKKMFKQLDSLKAVFEKIASWGIEYEVGEVGFPTRYANERKQRYFYDVFFRSFRQLLIDLKSKNVSLPKRVGIYETQDEGNISFGGPLERILKTKGINYLSRLVPNPENDFGLKNKLGEPKSILKGNLHRISADAEKPEHSQLRKIIHHVNRSLPEVKE